MNLIIDEGNTRIKLAVFDNDKVIEIENANSENFELMLNDVAKKYDFDKCIVSSVTDKVLSIFDKIKILKKVKLTYKTPLPFKIAYKTPKTLGVDRIALVAAAWYKYPNQNTLVIDAGTCITYEFINKQGCYLGGAIAPGLSMRYRAMHSFTEKLPLVKVVDEEISLIGDTTKSSMESGVVNGTMFEIEGTIEYYKEKYGNVNIILTGGDAYFLDKRLKNTIFVNQNFLLEGLNKILTYQN